MKIDAFTHVMPKGYLARLERAAAGTKMGSFISAITSPGLYDLDARIRVMDEFGIDQQVITLSSPPIEAAVENPKQAAELAVVANDEIAEMAARYPARFIPVGTIAMNNMDAAVKETERCLRDLGMKGILIYSNARRRAIDHAEFFPFYSMMAKAGLPIWIHPARGLDYADYVDETESKYEIAMAIGWAYETTLAMTRLVFSGVFEQCPGIKFVIHHAGAFVPLLEKRLAGIYSPNRPGADFTYKVAATGATAKLKKAPIDYFRMFYTDTVGHGSTVAVVAAYAFFGVSKLLFGTDSPFDFDNGREFTREHLGVIDNLMICPEEKELIYAGNFERLIGLRSGFGRLEISAG